MAVHDDLVEACSAKQAAAAAVYAGMPNFKEFWTRAARRDDTRRSGNRGHEASVRKQLRDLAGED